jgi:hypothetical protein
VFGVGMLGGAISDLRARDGRQPMSRAWACSPTLTNESNA